MSVFKKLKQATAVIADEAKKGAINVSNDIKNEFVNSISDSRLDTKVESALSENPNISDEELINLFPQYEEHKILERKKAELSWMVKRIVKQNHRISDDELFKKFPTIAESQLLSWRDVAIAELQKDGKILPQEGQTRIEEKRGFDSSRNTQQAVKQSHSITEKEKIPNTEESQLLNDKDGTTASIQEDQQTSDEKTSFSFNMLMITLMYPFLSLTILISAVCTSIGALMPKESFGTTGIMSNDFSGAIVGLVIGILIGTVIKAVVSAFSYASENLSTYPLLVLTVAISLIFSAIGGFISSDFSGAIVGFIVGILIGASIKIISFLYSVLLG